MIDSMKKSLIIFATALVLAVMAYSCGVDAEPLDLQPIYEYTDEYYEALKAYKESDHSICYCWFSDYGAPTTLAYRFAGIPDSVDVVSLWGGIPDEGTLDYEEMYEMRDKKGTKLVGVKIIRLAHTSYLPTWAQEIEIPTYMNGYTTSDGTYYPGYTETYESSYAQYIADGDSETVAAAAAETDAHYAGTLALIADMSENDSRIPNADSTEYTYPEWCVYAGNSILDEVETYDLDGYDLDYEPEGDALSGNCMACFLQYLSQYLGPASDTDKLLIVDGNQAPSGTPELINYWVRQTYNTSVSDSYFNVSGWENSQIIVTENIGDNWADGGYLEQQAAFQPSSGGRKGGFGAFYCQRDYNTTDSGADKDMPYGHLRRAIQLQNPAVTE